jgi:hypothetical protein
MAKIYHHESEYNSTKNFITDKSDNGTLYFKIAQELTNKIYRRRSNQYIAGEIIAIFSFGDIKTANSGHLCSLDRDKKIYFLILSNKFERNYLICPLFTKSLLSCGEFKEFEVDLGVISGLDETKLIYADLSRSHYINKEEFNNYVVNQTKLLNQNGEDLKILKLDKDKLRIVLKQYKKLLYL